jgi:hypothetical protein
MGRLIRFIHNRDLACENITTAHIRGMALLASPPRAMRSLLARLEARGEHMPRRSFISLSSDLAAQSRMSAGDFQIVISPSRRAKKIQDLTGKDRLEAIKTICRASNGAIPQLVEPNKCLVHTKGVSINGKKYAQGDHIEFYPRVRRRGNADGVGGRDGNIGSSLLGTVNMFYTFGHKTNDAQTFVEITPLPITDRIRDLFEIDAIARSEARLNGFARVPSGPTTMIHVDAVAFQVKVVPHFSNENKLLVLRMRRSR